MTENTLHLRFISNNKEFQMGAEEEVDVTEISGLESSDLDLVLTETARSDGSYVESRKIKKRPISIKACYRNNRDNASKRASVIRFFNPKFPLPGP